MFYSISSSHLVSCIMLLKSYLSHVWLLERPQSTLIRNAQQGTRSGHEDCYETFKKLVRNSEYSKSDNSKNFQCWPKFLVSYKTYVYNEKWTLTENMEGNKSNDNIKNVEKMFD